MLLKTKYNAEHWWNDAGMMTALYSRGNWKFLQGFDQKKKKKNVPVDMGYGEKNGGRQILKER